MLLHVWSIIIIFAKKVILIFECNMKKFWLAIIVFLGGFLGFNAKAVKPAPDQRNLAIYQIMVASFQHGEGGAEGYKALWGPDGHTKNGNLRGIINSLDYIKSLNVNAIWLTPIFDSSEASGGEKLQATGYFTNDYFNIDPHFGTDAEFQELVDEAHKRGLYVFLDGVFGHHGGVTKPSPKGNSLDVTVTGCDREDGGKGNVSYPGSLEYIKEVATYWIEKYGVDGWRLDQAYQPMQGGHNYWIEIRDAVEKCCEKRRNAGEEWGILGYMVGEDWGDASVVNNGVYRDGGLISAFDFQGKELISGKMQMLDSEGLENGWKDVITIYSNPMSRGYLNDDVMPNLFLSNHDGYRVADHISADNFYEKLMLRFAILAGYSGPVTLYYGDEFGDLSKNTEGGQKDNIARTSGHIKANNSDEQGLKDYVSRVFAMRKDNPAMWRGESTFYSPKISGAKVLVVRKTDVISDNEVLIVFSDKDISLKLSENSLPINVKALIPEIVKIR